MNWIWWIQCDECNVTKAIVIAIFLESNLGAHIFGCIETHQKADEIDQIDQIQIKGNKCFNLCRKKLKAGRSRGGIAV